MSVDLSTASGIPPLVEPGPELTVEEIERYSRHLTLEQVGEIGQRRLTNARVLVIGAGGLGAPVLHYLAAAGVGTIGIVDDDRVSVSNLQRQVLHGVEDVGDLKTESAARALARLNPLVTVQQHPVRLDAQNARDIVAGYDLVLTERTTSGPGTSSLTRARWPASRASGDRSCGSKAV